MNPFDTYEELLDEVEETRKPYQTVGYAPGGRPVIAVETGGTEEPAVLVTAGAHANEQAGVRAAVDLIDALETSHRTYVIPSRDPLGLDGYAAALELALAEPISVESFEDVEALLEAEGDIVHRDDDLILSLVGEHGFATKRPESDFSSPQRFLLQYLKECAREDPAVIEPFKSRRIFLPPGQPGIEGTGNFRRAYTVVVSPDGRVLHLNRFFTSDWAPPETRGVRRLMEEVKPGLTVDLHETQCAEDRFHVSLRPQQTETADKEEARVSREMCEAVSNAGIPLATDEDVLEMATHVVGDPTVDDPGNDLYDRESEGAYWVDPLATSPPRDGEGLNATDFAAERHGLAFTTETGMYGSFGDRTRGAVRAVQAGIRSFSDDYTDSGSATTG